MRQRVLPPARPQSFRDQHANHREQPHQHDAQLIRQIGRYPRRGQLNGPQPANHHLRRHHHQHVGQIGKDQRQSDNQKRSDFLWTAGFQGISSLGCRAPLSGLEGMGQLGRQWLMALPRLPQAAFWPCTKALISARKTSANCCSLASPTPFTSPKSQRVSGRFDAMSIRLRSLKMT